MTGFYSILYVQNGLLHKKGPFFSEHEALLWATNNETHSATEKPLFNVEDDSIYLLYPDHCINQLTVSDIRPST